MPIPSGLRGRAMRSLCVFASVLAGAPVIGQSLIQAARAAAANDDMPALVQEIEALLRYDAHEALQRADRAIGLAGDDPVSAALLFALKARADVKVTGPAAARADLDAAFQRMPDDAPQSARARMALWSATVHWNLDDVPDALTELRMALEFAEDSGERAVQIRSQLLAMSILQFPPDPVPQCEELLAQAAALQDPQLQLECELMVVHARRATGAGAETILDLRRILDRSHEMGDRVFESYVAQVLGRLLSRDSRLEAQAFFERAIASGKAFGDRELIGTAYSYFAEHHLAHREQEAARAAAESAVATLADSGMAARLFEALDMAVRTCSACGDAEAARGYSQRMIALNEEIANRQTAGDQRRYWEESAKMFHWMRTERERAAIDLRDARHMLTNSRWQAGFAVLAVALVASTMLWRSRRRLFRMNQRLQTEIETTLRMQEERAALQQNLQQLERLDGLGLLAGGFAHDFNNVLASVQGNAEVLLADDGLTDDQRDRVVTILESSRHGAGICRDVLDYARSGSTPVQPVDLRSVVQTILPLARTGFGARIAIATDLGAEAAVAEVDRTQIEQVLLNVLINAGEAIAGAGQVQVAIEHRELPGQPPSGHWFGAFDGRPRDCIAIRVRDNGIGMSPQAIRRIFDPFYSTRFPGRGLGLAATFAIVRRHHGVIHVHSEEGQGAAFTIFLPRSNQAPAAPPERAAEPVAVMPRPTALAPSRPEGPLVLVADDEPSVLEIAARILERGGLRTLRASGGEAALALLERDGSQVALALVDYTMPGLDGAVLVQRLKAMRPGLPVLVMSGHGENILQATLGDCHCIGKPFEAMTLLQRVRELLADRGTAARAMS